MAKKNGKKSLSNIPDYRPEVIRVTLSIHRPLPEGQTLEGAMKEVGKVLTAVKVRFSASWRE